MLMKCTNDTLNDNIDNKYHKMLNNGFTSTYF